MPPVEPPPSRWHFPQGIARIEAVAGDREMVAVGADLEPGTVLAAYRAGLFPMPLDPPSELSGWLAPRSRLGRGPAPRIGWWSPEPRGVLPLEGLVVSRSLRRSCRRFTVRVDTAFDEVISACGDPDRPGAWIDAGIVAAYRRLHRLGWAHSVEAWDADGLAGGLYGLSVGGLFAGESMFHRRPDASKVALVGLVERLDAGGGLLLDVQWATDHLRTLGARHLPRRSYFRALEAALAAPQLNLEP